MASLSILLAFALAQQASFPPQVEIRTASTPTVFPHDGSRAIVYELLVSNYDSRAVDLNNVAINAPGGASLGQFSGDRLIEMMRRLGAREPVTSTTLSPGATNVVYLWLPVNDRPITPREVQANVTMTPQDGKSVSVAAPSARVSTSTPITVGPPFLGDRWAAINGPSNDSPHRRTMFVLDGACYIGQRYAIDWVQVDESGSMFKDDVSKNENHYCYGKEALAVASGTVVRVHDGVPDNVPEKPPVVPIDLVTVGGNQVAIQIGSGRYALYAHLIPGSLKVKVGDRVTKGQVIGLIGNSGNSTAPHLHVQVCDGPNFLNSSGLPYKHSEYMLYDTKVEGDKLIFNSMSQVLRRNDTIIENQVVQFK